MICEHCNGEHDGSFGSGRFCSAKCAKRFSSSKVTDSGRRTPRKKFDELQGDKARRKALIKIRGIKCESCGGTTWKNQPIPLVLDHRDGNSDNSSLENLWLICPNCHALTPTFAGRNIGRFPLSRRNQGRAKYYRPAAGSGTSPPKASEVSSILTRTT